MNLLCDVSMFQVNHIFFLDTKKNMVIDGKFTKIVYSDSVVSLNGLYLYCPIESDQTLPVAKLPSELVVKRLSAPFQTTQVAHALHHPKLVRGQSFLVASGKVALPPEEFGPCKGNAEVTEGDRRSRLENYGSTIVTKKIPFIFSLLNPTNIYLIKEFNRIEHEIIEHYKEFFQIHKTNVYSLRNQLKSGNIKVVHKIPQLCSDYDPISFDFPATELDGIRPIVVKISGIWETDVSIGITFKFQI